MTTYGVTNDGFVIKDLDTILSEIEAAQRDNISPSLDTSTESPLGQLNGTFASIVRELWELAEAAYAANSPLTATGFALEQQAARVGITKDGASASTVDLTLSLDAAVTVPAGSRVQADGDASIEFETLAEAVNDGISPTTDTVQAQATSTGPTRANAGTLTVIVDSVSGWTAVTNVEDAVLGKTEEGNASLRARILENAEGNGTTTVAAIRKSIKAVANMIDVLVDENPTDQAVDGIPPHAFEAVIYDNGLADDDDIAQAIWDTHAGGIETYGSESGMAVDEFGDSQSVGFSRVSTVPVYLEIDVTVDQSYPETGDAGLKLAVADWGDLNLYIGNNVVESALYQPVFDYGGVVDVTAVRLGLTVVPTGTDNVTIARREIADLDTGRIVVTKTTAT